MSQPRTPAEVLREARRKDSRDKRARVLQAVDHLLAAGEAVTFTGVARAANVSHWLVYADGMREHIEAARRRQTRAADSDAHAGATVTHRGQQSAANRSRPSTVRRH